MTSFTELEMQLFGLAAALGIVVAFVWGFVCGRTKW